MKQKQSVQEDQNKDQKDQMDGTSPEPEEATFSEMLRDGNTISLTRTPAREALSGEAAFCGVLRSCFWDRCSISV